MIPEKQKVVTLWIIGILIVGMATFAFIFSMVSAKDLRNNHKSTDRSTFIENQHNIQVGKVEKETETKAYEVTGPLSIEVVLQRHYLDGEVSKELVTETILSMEDFWAAYSSWELVKQEQGKIIFKKEIDDISPLLKANGYFGVSEDGILKVYDGKPSLNNVIQSFYQLNIEELESRKQQELMNGIPVLSKDNYQDVIKSFKNYSLQKGQTN